MSDNVLPFIFINEIDGGKCIEPKGEDYLLYTQIIYVYRFVNHALKTMYGLRELGFIGSNYQNTNNIITQLVPLIHLVTTLPSPDHLKIFPDSPLT
jgi:hypothetical protein